MADVKIGRAQGGKRNQRTLADFPRCSSNPLLTLPRGRRQVLALAPIILKTNHTTELPSCLPRRLSFSNFFPLLVLRAKVSSESQGCLGAFSSGGYSSAIILTTES